MVTIDAQNSDIVQYMLSTYPHPNPVYVLPPMLKERRDKIEKDGGEPLIVCVFGYSSLAKEIIESLRDDVNL